MNRSLALLICMVLAGCSSLSVQDTSVRVTDSGARERGPGSSTSQTPRRTTPGAAEEGPLQERTARKARQSQNPNTPANSTQLPKPEADNLTLEPAEDQVAVGFASIAAQPGNDATEKRLQAVRASRLDAYRTLAEQVFGLEFRIEYKSVDGKITDEVFHTRSQGVIRGAEVLSVEPLGSDQYQATVRLRASEVQRLRESFARGTQPE